MGKDRRIALTIVLGCFLLGSLVPFGSAIHAGEDVIDEGQRQHHSSIGGRILLQNLNPCPHQFSLDNFTNLELACPPANVNSTNYPKKSCCAALADMLCPWLSYINDPNSDCARSYWSTLPLATNQTLTQSFFMDICTDTNSPEGIACPRAPAPAPNWSPPPLSSQFGDVTISLAAAVIGYLHFRL